ncbi:MMP14 protein, partial [Pseudoatta argentina]
MQLLFEEGEIKQAISLFQEYYQILGDGVLNNYTLHQMRKPRCGLPDILHHEHNTDTKKWAKTEQWHIYLTEKSASNKDYLLNTLTHEIEHALGLKHSSREDSIMFAFVTANNSNKIVKLNIEDILAVQQLYGIKNPKPTTTTQPPTSTTTEITTNKPEYVDLCTLQYMDMILVLHHRIFVMYQRYVWSIDIDDTKYDGPHILNSYMDFLPENTSLSAAYQRPSGELILFVNKKQQFYTFNEFTRTLTEAVGNLTLRFGQINNLLILRLKTSTARLSMSKSTVLNRFTLEHCVNRPISSLTAMTDNVDKKCSRLLAIASTVTKSANVLKTMYDNESFDRNDILDCKLIALIFGER